MAYKFTPKSEDEVQAEQLCAAGKYPFTVLESAETKSKSEKNPGAPMIKLKLNVHADDGFDYHVYDYIADWFMAHKFRHFFFSIGLGAEYDRGEIDAAGNALAGREGWCDISIQKASGNYGPKNTVKDYVVDSEKAEPEPARQPTAPGPDDDVPF